MDFGGGDESERENRVKEFSELRKNRSWPAVYDTCSMFGDNEWCFLDAEKEPKKIGGSNNWGQEFKDLKSLLETHGYTLYKDHNKNLRFMFKKNFQFLVDNDMYESGWGEYGSSG